MDAKSSDLVLIRAARPGEIATGKADADLAHARSTDPDGGLVAIDASGRVSGTAVAVAREDTLLLLALDVEETQRGRGVGRALLAAVRAYGAARGASLVEVLAPLDSPSLAFFLRAGLSIRTIVLSLEASAAAPPTDVSRDGPLGPVSAGAPLTGWVAALDRETRGFARPRDWSPAAEAGRVVSLKRSGRPVALGAWSVTAEKIALGPLAAKSAEAAADFLPLLAARVLAQVGGAAFSLALPAEAGGLLAAARSLGFRAVATRVLLTDRGRGDLRRYAGGGGRFF